MVRHTETTRAKSPESWGWAVEHPDPPVPKWYIPQFAHKFVQYKWSRRLWVGTPTAFVVIAVLFPRLAFALVVCMLDVIRQDWDMRIHRKRVVKPLAKALAPLLNVTWKGYLHWLDIPIDVDADEANVTLTLPVEWQGREDQTAAVSALMNRRLPGQWEAQYHHAGFTVDFVHPPPPPESYSYDPALTPDEGFIPIGVGSRGKIYEIDLDGKTPHFGVFGSTGWGKTVTLQNIIARARKQGGLIDICDPKRIGYLTFKNVPGINIHTGIERMIAAIHAFYVEVDARYKLIEQGIELDPKEYPRRFLILDEMGTLVTDGKIQWRNDGNKTGTPDFILDCLRIAWLGRAAKMHLGIGAHEANADVLFNNDFRNQLAMVIATGPISLGAWRKMFGNEPKMKTRSKKGASIVGIGDELVRLQLANITPETARAEALAGVPVDVPIPPLPGDMPTSVHVVPDGASLVVGMKAGAAFLKMTPAAFAKARQREPEGKLHGEQRQGRSPTWTPDVLMSWHRLRVRAGERDIPPSGEEVA